MKIKVHQAKPAEVTDIKNLLSHTWADTYSEFMPQETIDIVTSVWHDPERLKQQIENENTFFGVAKLKDNTIVGLTTVTIDEDQSLIMHRLYVHPHQQRQGIGQTLLAEAIKQFPSSVSIKIEVEEANSKGLGFYKKVGFVETGRKDEVIEGQKMRVIEMEMKLPIDK